MYSKRHPHEDLSCWWERNDGLAGWRAAAMEAKVGIGVGEWLGHAHAAHGALMQAAMA